MKNKFGLLDTDLETVNHILGQQPKVEHAYIFGSRAKGNFKNVSDVDIALNGTGLDLDTINKISFWLNEETAMPYTFDVLDYDSIEEPALKEHIDRAGIEFYRRWNS